MNYLYYTTGTVPRIDRVEFVRESNYNTWVLINGREERIPKNDHFYRLHETFMAAKKFLIKSNKDWYKKKKSQAEHYSARLEEAKNLKYEQTYV